MHIVLGGDILIVLYIRKKQLLYFLFGLLLLIVLLFAFNQFSRSDEMPVVNPIYIGNTADKAVALMVNVDWGEDVLPEMLKVFKEKETKATFFITGRFAKKFPEIVKIIADAGHEIGNHGYSHPHPDKISLEKNMKEITDTEQVFKELNINYSMIYAPPYGEHKEHVLDAAESLGYKTIMWTADTIDWQEPTPEQIIKRVTSKADNGVLVLMHPKKCTVEALPSLIAGLHQENYLLKTITEIIQ